MVERVLYEGTVRTSQEAEETVALMRKAMGLTSIWNRISRKGRQAIEREAKAEAAADA
jgi:tryptophanyl-tRNA synthetase